MPRKRQDPSEYIEVVWHGEPDPICVQRATDRIVHRIMREMEVEREAQHILTQKTKPAPRVRDAEPVGA